MDVESYTDRSYPPGTIKFRHKGNTLMEDVGIWFERNRLSEKSDAKTRLIAVCAVTVIVLSFIFSMQIGSNKPQSPSEDLIKRPQPTNSL